MNGTTSFQWRHYQLLFVMPLLYVVVLDLNTSGLMHCALFRILLNGVDWVCQSAVMDEIYGNATITLAAAAGSTVWDGILTKTTELALGLCNIPFKIKARKLAEAPATSLYDRKSDVIAVSDSTATIRFYPYDIDATQALSSRAWAFQESAMSRRILSYQKEQIVWQCKTKKQYKNGPLNVQPLQAQKPWVDCVVQYTKCELTFQDDRLMAISAYAKSKHKEYQAQGSENKYLAGLWQSGLVDHLLWISKVKPPPPRPTNYRAPTWSWASINGPVEFVPAERKGTRHCAIELLSASMATNPLNPFGTLEKMPLSYLHLRGFLKAVPGMEIPSRSAPLPLHKEFRRTVAWSWWIEFDTIDVAQRVDQALAEASGEDVAFLELCKLPMYCLRMTEFTALILIPTSKVNGVVAFERVGIVRHWHREDWKWFDDERERTELYLL